MVIFELQSFIENFNTTTHYLDFRMKYNRAVNVMKALKSLKARSLEFMNIVQYRHQCFLIIILQNTSIVKRFSGLFKTENWNLF